MASIDPGGFLIASFLAPVIVVNPPSPELEDSIVTQKLGDNLLETTGSRS